MTNEFDILMERFFGGTMAYAAPRRDFPYTDIYGDETTLTMEIALAGYTKESIDVSIDGNVLRIEGKIDREASKNRRYAVNGIKKADFKVSYSLGSEWVDKEIKTTFENGLLRIIFTKEEPKKIKLL